MIIAWKGLQGSLWPRVRALGLCVAWGMDPSSEAVDAGAFVAYLAKARNGTKLPAQLTTSMGQHMVLGMKLLSIDEIECDEPDEMEEIATEAWKDKFGEDLPKAFATRIRKWAGEVSTSSGKKETLATPLGEGEIGENIP